MATKKLNARFSLLGLGAILAFLSLVALSAYLVVTLAFKGESQVAVPTAVETVAQKEEEVEIPWRLYTNEEFGYEVSHPGLLYQRELVNQGGYEHFVRFEETAFSVDKGIAVGVAQRSLDEEVTSTKEFFQQDSELVEEKNISINDLQATHLLFRPNVGEAEERAVVIFEKEGFAYSISTVPEQIEKVMETFKFLN